MKSIAALAALGLLTASAVLAADRTTDLVSPRPGLTMALSRPAAPPRATGLTPADLRVVLFGHAEVVDGDVNTYQLTLHNDGTDPILAPIVIAFELSDGQTLEGIGENGWSCGLNDPTHGDCEWAGDLDPGQATTSVLFDARAGGPYPVDPDCHGLGAPCVFMHVVYTPFADVLGITPVVVGGNHPPRAVTDSADIPGAPAPVTINVLANDTDADGDPLVVSIETNPALGSAMVNAAQEIVYTPDATYAGNDVFRYRVTDPAGATASAGVAVQTVSGPPGEVRFRDALIDIGQVEIGRVVMKLGWIDNLTGHPQLAASFVLTAVPAADVPAVLQGTGYDPTHVVFDPAVFQVLPGVLAGTEAPVFPMVKPRAPLGTVFLARLTLTAIPLADPSQTFQATTYVVARSATGAEVPIHILDDHILVAPDVTTIIYPLANDSSPTGALLSIGAGSIADPFVPGPPYTAGTISFVLDPATGIPALRFTPDQGFIGDTFAWYAGTEYDNNYGPRRDWAKVTITVGPLPPAPVAVASGSAAVCEGNSTPLSGAGAVYCSWSPGAGLSNAASCTPSASPTSTTTYTLTVIDAQGQSSINNPTVTVTVNSRPGAFADGTATILLGGSAPLTGTGFGPVSCAWSPAAGLDNPASCTPIASPASTTTYALVVTSPEGCASTNPATVVVTVIPPPTAIASGSASLCPGGSAALSGSGGVSCSWAPSTGLDDPSSCSPIATPAATTTYTLTVVDTYGQTSTNNPTVTVTVNPLPTAVACGSATIPLGGSAPLTGAGGASCQWSPATGLSNAASCTPIASPATTTTYSLMVTSAEGCSSVNGASATVTVQPPPSASASGSATVCAGASTPLAGSGGVSCSWSPATGLSNPASCTPSASPASTTTYTLTVFDNFGQASANNPTVTVTVDPLPTAVAGGSITIPVGGSAPLTGSGGASCAWSPATGLSNAASCTPIASPTSTTTYSLVVTSAAGCGSVNVATATVTVVAGPPIAVASGSASICQGGSAPLTGSGGVSCSWSPATGLSNPASCTPFAAPASTTTYTLTVLDAYGQPSTNNPTVTVTVNPLPTAIAGGTTTVPLGGTAVLTGSGGASCAWSPAAGLDNAASCNPHASPITTITYSLVVTSAAGCGSVNAASATVTVQPPPTASASGSASICAGASTPLHGSGGVSCAWSPATGLSNAASCTPSANPASTTTYTLVVRDAFGQASTNNPTVTVTVNPLPTAVASGSATIPLGGSAPLTGAGGASCQWSPATGLSNAASCAPIASPTSTTTYALVVTSAAGCSSVNGATATVTVVPPQPLQPDLVDAVLVPFTARPNQAIQMTVGTLNLGAGNAAASTTRFYLSRNAVLDPSDVSIGLFHMPPLAAGAVRVDLANGVIPANARGNYYVIAFADDGRVIAETNETNNAGPSAWRIQIR